MRGASVCALVLAAAGANAQGLRVRVVDDGSGAPLRAAWLTLLDAGDVVGEGLVRADGARFFPAAPGKAYTLIVERVGHEPFAAPGIRVANDTVVVRAAPRPIALRRGDLSAAPRCTARPEGLAAQLWSQARIAIAAVDQALTDGSELLALRRTQRVVGRDGEVKTENTVDGRALGTTLFPTAPPEDLSRAGFVVAGGDGQPAYRGPSGAYLLSQQFLRDHCFSAVQGSGATAGMIGLRFRQRPGPRPVGVEGTLWVDGDSAALRLLEFRYAGAADAQAGGRLLYDRLPAGSWIAREWMLRTPVTTQGGTLLGYREDGGETLVVPPTMLAVADSVENSRRDPGRIAGVIIDSLTRTGLAGALVTTDVSGPRARTDSSGTFWLRNVPAGWRRVTFSHPMLDSLGAPVRSVRVRVGPDSTTNVALGTPSLATLKGGACDDSMAVIAGTVRDVASGRPVDSARVALSWISIVFRPDRPLRVSPVELAATTDSAGRYAACVPPRLDVTAWAATADGAARTGRVDVAPDDRGVSILDLALDRAASDTLAGGAELRGVVLYQDRTPIAGAEVLLTDPERTTTTDSLGRFVFRGIPGGTRVLASRALGHAPARAVVTASAGDTSVARLYMRRVTELDAIIVRASAGTAGRAIAELEEHRRTGAGYRLTPIELLGFRNGRMDAVVRALPLVRVRSAARGTQVLLPGPAGKDCSPDLFVDGQKSAMDVLELISASDALAVEVFPSAIEVPPRYRTSKQCGVILVWTREKR